MIQELYENKENIIEEIINAIFYIITTMDYKFLM